MRHHGSSKNTAIQIQALEIMNSIIKALSQKVIYLS